jgi:hypothetical protein
MTLTATSPPSNCSDLNQALAALKDLADATPLRPDPLLLSAWQQARIVLRRHGIDVRRAPTGLT